MTWEFKTDWVTYQLKKKKGKEKNLWCSWAGGKIPINNSNMRKRRRKERIKENNHTRAYIPFTTKYSILIIQLYISSLSSLSINV